MTLTRHESNDSAVSRDNNSADRAPSVADTAERFRMDIPSLFQRPESQQSQEPIRLAHAGHGAHFRDTSPSPRDKAASPERVGDKQFSDFAKANGLELTRTADKKLEFSLKNGGEKLVIGTVEPGRAGLDEITKKLKEFTELKQWDLEQRFGVKFAAPGGEQKLFQQVQQGDQPPKPGKELNLRAPKLRELLGIEAALEKANPSHKTDEGAKPLTFYFLKDSTYYKGSAGVATFEKNANGGPAVIVEPNTLDRAPITERDKPKADFTNHRSIESVIVHELGHHTEERIGATPEEKAELYKQMGWTPIPGMPRSPQGDYQWMLKGPNGEGYAPAGLAPGLWVRFDRNGREQGRISPEQAAQRALTKPPTPYMEGPHEVLAEGLTMLRLGEGYRSHLMNRDSNLYQAIKDADQRELDKNFGQGQMMRSYAGAVVPRTEENLRALKEREDKDRMAARTRR